jgi:hypothetical protein
MMRKGRGSLLIVATVIAFAVAGCCDSDKPLGIRESGVGAGPPVVALGATLSSFGVLAGSTVTNTGATTVDGDLGVSPGSAITGFFPVDGGPGTVSGTIHAGDATAATAQTALTAAYNDALSRTVNSISLSGDLTGLTLTPGLYTSTSSLGITGDVTLNALGNADAVFIIKMASTLTTGTGSHVILTGGAQASNIIWQVGTSATLGTNSVFNGTILADQSITLTTGTEMNGRALARTGAVTLDTNAIVAQ